MGEEIIKRVMPHSIEAEQSVIGSMLLDAEAIGEAAEIVTAEDFYHKSYGVIFEAMQELQREGKPVDLITLKERLTTKNVAPEVASLEFVRDLMNTVPTSANVKAYARIVSDKSLLRKLIRITDTISNSCFSGQDPVEVVMDSTEKAVFGLLQDREQTEYKPIRKLAVDVIKKIEAASKVEGAITGIPTGFADLDRMLSGLQNSDLILIAARPSMGKTAFALNIAQHVAFKEHKNVAIFSLEMSNEQLVNRLFALEGQIDASKLRAGRLSPEEWERLVEACDIVGTSGLIIDDTPGISISKLRSKCRKFKLEHGLDLIIIDYLQLMTAKEGRNDSRQQEVSDISRALKGIARELKVPVIALSQLSRMVEQREDHRPRMSDLRESGAIEQDADVVMFIYRDEVYNKDSEDNKGQAEIIVGKQRNGPIGTVQLVWLPQYTKFANKANE